MLTELRIRNVGVIDDVTLHLGPGLNVLTGETGAGKTMVVSALELLLGARADADRVRSGASVAVVEASLAPPPSGAAEWLDEGDEELIVSREVAAGNDGSARSRARLGGRMAPVSALAACVGAAVELHGQSDTSRLAASAVQRELLDRFGGAPASGAITAYRQAFTAWTAARSELSELQSSTRDRAREADRVRFELDEIDAVAPRPGDDDQLTAEMSRLEHTETLLVAADGAGAALLDEDGAHDALAAAVAALRAESGVDAALDELAARTESLRLEAQDVGLELRAYGSGLEADPARLEALRTRHADLVRLSRKYGEAPSGGVDPAGVVAYAEQARFRLEALEGGDERAEALAAQVAALADEVTDAAQRLRDERTAAAKLLAEAVHGHLGELSMAAARLDVAIEPADPQLHGADKVTFLLAANAGEPALPLGKAASGGERSRVALALRLALADADDTAVLVFDEVDAGIGGATANAVGAKLARLARGRQVLCVTHLPQLAAYADRHFNVAKREDGGRTVATVVELGEDARVGELSRMLSGMPDSAVAADHAAELLATARSTV